MSKRQNCTLPGHDKADKTDIFKLYGENNLSCCVCIKMLVFVTDQPSGSLSGAEIFGIVCGMLALLDIIFGVGAGLYILTKSE